MEFLFSRLALKKWRNIGGGTEIIDYEGRYRITPRKELILSDHPLRERIAPGVNGNFTDGGKKYKTTPFEFNDIRWMIVGER
jgi:hypothetical protein